ncbi:MAG TPA: pyrroline-5-carboxylate reductase [Gammaproteobacteria bacterium]|nr:pyrroline-5-carboxylate reductase [Gammaproteobacteria bacterium]
MTKQHATRIAFIGAGNMARSLIGGVLQHGFVPAQVTATDPNPAQRAALEQAFSIRTGDDNVAAAEDADVVVFAVKPQVMRDAVRAVAPTLARTRPLVVSIAAGIAEPDIRRWLGYDAAIVRVMPNTPALLGCGASALFANRFVAPAQRELAMHLLEAVGIALWLEDEQLMDAVTAVSGCGPAYFFLLMEAMQHAAEQLALPADTARRLIAQTALGAARMASVEGADAATLRRQVASPGGTTEAALKVLQAAEFETLVLRALRAARDRGIALSREFGGDAT